MEFEPSKGAGNPFLMDDYPSAATPLATAGLSSNPFLSGTDFAMPASATATATASDNPFLTDAAAAPTSFISSSTNPFAQFTDTDASVDFFSSTGVDDTDDVTTSVYSNIFAVTSSASTTVDIFAVTSSASTTVDNIFSSTSSASAVDIFAVTSSASTTVDNIFTAATSSAPPGVVGGGGGATDFFSSDVTLLEDAPTTLDESAQDVCKETCDILSGAAVPDQAPSRSGTPKSHPGPPKRPPPPRPPPSKETKELILSVTGAMEATSSHLLDRLQATRTPSPTPIRDLHSPSPTPEGNTYSELLAVSAADDSKLPHFQPDTELNLLGDDDVVDGTPVSTPGPPQRPPRPKVPAPSQHDFMDMFLSEDTTAPSTNNADILGLFDAPTMDTTASDGRASDLLLDGDFGEGPAHQDMELMAPTVAQPGHEPSPPSEIFHDMMEATPAPAPGPGPVTGSAAPNDDFDDFAAKFESAARDEAEDMSAVHGDPFDPFASSGQAASNGQTMATAMDTSGDVSTVWGTPADADDDKATSGFGTEDAFDAFLSMSEPPPAPQSTPARVTTQASADSDDGPDLSVFIRPAPAPSDDAVPALAPPPRSPVVTAATDSSPRFNPFDKSSEMAAAAVVVLGEEPALPQGAEVPEGMLQRTESQETPPTPLFDEDVSQPLEPFPRISYSGDGWDMHLRQPNKKKITGQRFWKKVYVRLVTQADSPVLQLYNTREDKDPFQELPLQACYSVSDIGAQQFDAYGKIFTVKLQYVFYKERPGVRPGQVTKAERLTSRLSQFAAYAMQGDLQACKEFGSDLRKLGLPVEHAPQISQLFKMGSQQYEDMKQFSVCVEEALFRLAAHRERALNYKTEEVQITAVDELYVEQHADGHVDTQIARVRLFFLGFLAGMPDVELGVNDLWRQGKEVVGRHDIIPVITEEWIRLEDVEFHSCVQQDEYERTRVIKFKPPDACYIELMRFRVRPPRNRELPLQVKAVMCVTGNKVELKSEILVPGFSSRKLGQIPCEDIMVRFPIPECWIYLFRVEKHFRYGSVKSAHRRTGKVKGIERLLGAVETLEQSLIEVTSGQAKYEHQHRAIVWRMARLPKEGQGAYTTHTFVCRMALTSYDQVPPPSDLAQHAYVEFTMPATQVSHTTVRSVSVCDGAKDEPPEKYVRYLARHEYRVGIEHTQGEGPAAYIAATITTKAAAAGAAAAAAADIPVLEEKPEGAADSDSDSSS